MTATAERGLLLSPFKVGSLQLRNRVVMAPHSTHYADRVESDRLTAYYRARAEGGVGLIVHEPVIVHPSSLSRVGKIWGYARENAEAYRATTDAVHEAGAAIVCQIIHNGRQVDGHESQMPAWYPSEVQRGGTIEISHAMTVEEIAEVVEGFVETARICAAGGFDGVEVHAAHGYLLQGFLSPATNQRTDHYGGTVQNRTRIVLEIIRAIRAELGSEFVIGVRVTGDEVQPGGLNPEDCVEISALLAPEVDYLSVVSGSLASYDRIVPEMSFERGLNVRLAGRIRAAVAPVPVLVTGRIPDPETAERILIEEDADLIGLARALIVDPQWVAKVASGATEQIRPCVYANDCRDSIGGRRALVCMVNPDAGRERELVRIEPRAARRVLVIGAGPAGLEAALTASANGDQVTLLERSSKIGGQLNRASAPKSRRELGRLLRYYQQQLAASSIELRLGVEPDTAMLRSLDPTMIVLATGAVPVPPTNAVLSAWEVLGGATLDAKHVVLQDVAGGNGWPLFAAAELLADTGHEVTVVTAATALGTGIEAAALPPLMRRFKARGVRVEMHSRALPHPEGVVVVRNDTDEERIVPGAALVVESGRRSAGVAGAWDGLGVPVVAVGDVLAPRRLATALAEGRRAGAASFAKDGVA
ncbi:FAD-dependent oxidoreductase [Nocardioides sp. Bht2]|uniref:oxidoreductase n=1 Tax=Nocardioides sp. Bht2 TaxID=3392297 RepID=UPI0039B5449A